MKSNHHKTIKKRYGQDIYIFSLFMLYYFILTKTSKAWELFEDSLITNQGVDGTQQLPCWIPVNLTQFDPGESSHSK